MKRHRLRIVLPMAAAVLIAGAVLFLLYGTRSATVQRWIAGQLSAVANQYLNPQLSLGAVRYEYPLTAVVDDVRLVAADPARPGATVDIFAAARVTLTMAEIPRAGQPLRIQRLILERPVFRAVGVGGEDASLVGYGHLLRGPSAAPTTVKLSDVFEIREVEVVDGHVVYDPRAGGTKPMEIDGIRFRLDVEPAVRGGEAGWYAVDLSFDRRPVLAARLAGRVNLDTWAAEIRPARVELRVGRDQDHYLPPELQSFLRAHEVGGHLVVEAQGSVCGSDWRASNLTVEATLAGGHFAAGEHHLPVDRLQLRWSQADRRGRLETFDATLLGGQMQGSATVDLDDPMEGQVDLTLSHLRLEQCLRNAAGDESKYRGDLCGEIAWRGPMTDVGRQSGGGGSIRIVDGRLAQVPVLSHLLTVATRTLRVVGVARRPSDTANLAFTFAGDRVNFHKIFVVTRLAALDGRGDLYFDTRLDMLFNAGPVKKIESMLGKVGTLVGKITDEVAAYTLTGTLSEPRVRPKVAPNLPRLPLRATDRSKAQDSAAPENGRK